MKLELISENKLRAELSFEDMECLGFSSYENVGDDAVETIIGIADERLGFHAAASDCKISVYPFGDGCEIYITKQSEKKTVKKTAKRRSVLSFENAEDLIRASVFVSRQDISDSECRCEKRRSGIVYHLIVEYECDCRDCDGDPYWLSAVSELCNNEPSCKRSAFINYLEEHSEILIAKNAADTIAKMKKR